MPVTHTFVTPLPNNPIKEAAGIVSSDAWNDDHVVSVDLTTEVTGALPSANGGVPSGGTTGQALTKNSNTNYDVTWSTVSASPGGSNTQLQYNNSGSFGGTAAAVYSGTGTHITITSQGSGVIPLALTGTSVGDVQRWTGGGGLGTISVNADSQFVAKGGATGSPGYTFSGALTTGFYRSGNSINIAISNTQYSSFDNLGRVLTVSGGKFGFSSNSTSISANPDVALERSAAAVLKVTNGLSTMADLEVLDEAYGVTWDGSLEVPTKNAVYDKIQSMGGGGSPGGSNTQVQFNDGGAFGGNAGFTFDKTTNFLLLGDPVGPSDGYLGIINDPGTSVNSPFAIADSLGTPYFTVSTNGDVSTSGGVTATTTITVLSGDLNINGVGKTLYIKQGSGGMSGRATMVSGVATITIAGLTTNDDVYVNLITPGGTMGARVKAVCTANTLTITAIGVTGTTTTSDTSTYSYFIVRPA